MSERVELDRLADYAAGLLDGTPQAEVVARLIATDPAWAEAYARLTEADRRVRGDLAALRAEEPMPADVVARLRAALDDARAVDREAGRSVVSLDAARRRRRRRWTAAVGAAAAGVVAFGVFGVPALRGTDGGVFTTTLGGSDAAERMSAPDAPGTDADLAGGLRILASGTDYRRENLTPPPAKVTAASPEHDMAGPDRLGAAAGHDPLAAAAPQLRRLVDRGALHACLGALVTAYGGRPTSVDYARFEGAPALVVHLAASDAAPARLVVVGPDCGLPGVGPDVRYTATVE
ncbi:MAG: hypothetical protein FWJ93_02025 [Micromonosporaceae bacterium]